MGVRERPCDVRGRRELIATPEERFMAARDSSEYPRIIAAEGATLEGIFLALACRRMITNTRQRVMNMNARRQLTWLSAAALTVLALQGCGAEGPEPSLGQDRSSEDAPDGVVSVAAKEAAAVGEGNVEKAIFTCVDPATCCSRAQMNTVADDESLATEFLENVVNSGPSLQSFATPRASQLLQIDFGPLSADDLTFVLGTYGLVKANLPNTQYTCEPESNSFCTSGAQAFNVSPDQTDVGLCPLYFEVGANGRAQTLIHEATHQRRNTPDGLGTDDLGTASIFDASSYARYAPKCTISPGCF
jgi:lysine-specific metallo-endopeptidase family protein